MILKILITVIGLNLGGDGADLPSVILTCLKKGLVAAKLRLEQGRTHQIRLHMASIGCPLSGDPLYGTGIKGETHAMLHCERVMFEHPFTHKEIIIHAPFPNDWQLP